MLSDMLLLPLRLAARVTRLGLHLTEQAALDALSAARRLTGTPTSRAPRAAGST